MSALTIKYLRILAKIASESHVVLFLVGGTVRDHLLGKECSDFDFTATNVQSLANQFAVETRSPCVSLDATPGRNTWRVIIEKQFHFDFTDMQGDSIEEDLKQRDFSINAMALRLTDFLEGHEVVNAAVIDPNQGQADLRNQMIRVLPGPIFLTDPLRMLRAFRFSSSLKFDISTDTLRQIEVAKSHLEKTARERIYYEWILFLSGEHIFELLQLMNRTGLLDCLFPEIAELHSSTPAGSWETSLHSFKRLEDILSIPETTSPAENHAGFLAGRKKALLKFSALLHPLNSACLEASSSFKVKIDEESKIVRLLKKLTASNADIRFIFRTIQCQQEALDTGLEFAGARDNESAMYRFTKKYDTELMTGIFLARAVQSATEKKSGTESFLQAAHRMAEFYFLRYLPALENEALITGDDLIRDFKIKPSPLFQLILNEVEEGRVLGTLQSKDQATTAARQIIATHNKEQET